MRRCGHCRRRISSALSPNGKHQNLCPACMTKGNRAADNVDRLLRELRTTALTAWQSTHGGADYVGDAGAGDSTPETERPRHTGTVAS